MVLFNVYTMDTLMVLFNVYTLGYPDGFIQCTFFQKQVLKMNSREAETPAGKKLIYTYIYIYIYIYIGST